MPRAEAPPKGSLDRALEIFDVLTVRGKATTAELVEAVGISRSAVYRLVERLQASEYLTLADGHWRLGPAAARMAMAAVQTMDVLAAAPPLLRDLASRTGETVNLGVLSGEEIVFVFRELGHHAVQVRSELGARRPLHATAVGKAYLAGLAPERLDDVIECLGLERFTEATITGPDRLREEITETRRRGWAEEHGEFDASSTCFGAPIFDQSGAVNAAVSIAGPSSRMDDAATAFGPLVAEAAGTVSRRLGYVKDASLINR
ncbi:MAG TPA: IclR family transcriptional regulator [Glycomyces sp.]|nr:IclR family transcriptional regulator [Glycomyces sp.]